MIRGCVSNFQRLTSGGLYLGLKTVLHAFTQLTTGHACTYREAKPNLYSDAGLPWLPRWGSNECLTGLIRGREGNHCQLQSDGCPTVEVAKSLRLTGVVAQPRN